MNLPAKDDVDFFTRCKQRKCGEESRRGRSQSRFVISMFTVACRHVTKGNQF